MSTIMRKTLSIVSMSAAVFLLATQASEAKCTKGKWVRGEGISPTCYNIEYGKSRAFVGEISRDSVQLLLDEALKRGSPTADILKDLDTEFEKDRRLKSVVFRLDHTAKDPSGATDCWIYATHEPRKPNWDRKVLSLGTGDCVGIARSLSFDLAMALQNRDTRLLAETNKYGSTINTSMFDNLFLEINQEAIPQDSPWRRYINTINSTNYTAEVLAFHGVDAGDVPGAEHYVTETPYPYTKITVQEKQTLWEIAKNISGSNKYWTALWAFNSDSIGNPHFIKAGQEIRVPLKFSAQETLSTDLAPAQILEQFCLSNENISCRRMPSGLSALNKQKEWLR